MMLDKIKSSSLATHIDFLKNTLGLCTSQSLKSNAFLGIPRPAGKGARVIIIGMGNQNGWIPNSAQVWKRTAKDGVVSGDYHSDINAEGFEKWLRECLPNLPPNR